jgi:hypothetical protein
VYHAISLWQHRCLPANCGFAAVFPTPKHTGLRHLGGSAGKKQCYGLPKTGLSEANHFSSYCPCPSFKPFSGLLIIKQKNYSTFLQNFHFMAWSYFTPYIYIYTVTLHFQANLKFMAKYWL